MQTEASTNNRRYLGLLRRLLGWLFIAAFVYFFATTLGSEWPKLSSYHWQPNWLYLGLAAIILFVRPPIAAWGWRALVGRLGGPSLDFRQVIHVYFAAALSRYLPGTVWYAVGRVVLGERLGVSRAVGSLALLLETAFITFSGLLVAPFALAATPALRGFDPLVLAAGYGLFLVVALFFLWRNDIFFGLLNFALRRFKRQPLTIELSFGAMLRLNLPFFINWLLYALMSYLLVAGVYPLPLDLAVPVGACFVAAWAVGFLTIVAPSGLGVREGTLVLLLRYYLPASVAALPPFVAVISRLGSIISEIPWAVLAAIYAPSSESTMRNDK